MTRVYVSPPFGHWLHFDNTLPVDGSYTVLPRRGRLWRVLKTVRPVNGGWVNSIGLRNCGISNVRYQDNLIYSLAGIADGDWEILYNIILDKEWREYRLELNLSCLNVDHYDPPKQVTLRQFSRLPNCTISAKFKPEPASFNLAETCLLSGIANLHFSNTAPSSRGGISGTSLRAINLPIVEEAARIFPEANIIAGGGIYCWQDWLDYKNAGAVDMSLGTVFMNPPKAMKLMSRLHREKII